MVLKVFQQKPLNYFATISQVSWLRCLIFHFFSGAFLSILKSSKLLPYLKKNLNLNVLAITQYLYFRILTKFLKEYNHHIISFIICNSAFNKKHFTSQAFIHLTDKIRERLDKLWLWNICWLSKRWYLFMISLFENWLIMA